MQQQQQPRTSKYPGLSTVNGPSTSSCLLETKSTYAFNEIQTIQLLIGRAEYADEKTGA